MTKPKNPDPNHHRQKRFMPNASYTNPRNLPDQSEIERMLWCSCDRPNVITESETDVTLQGKRTFVRQSCLKCGKGIK